MSDPTQAPEVAVERWWITTDFFANGGGKVLGPFESRHLALHVRTYVEAMPQHYRPDLQARRSKTLAVDQERAEQTVGEVNDEHS